jgi:hypothetical protein
MAVVIQYAFNNENQWKSAGEPKLVDTASEIIVLGKKIVDTITDPETGEVAPVFETNGKYYVEVLFADYDEVPDNGLLANKAVSEIPHHFIGYPISVNEQETFDSQNPE